MNNAAILSQFEAFLANHPEVQAAATSLREEHFNTFLANNSNRFAREFARSLPR